MLWIKTSLAELIQDIDPITNTAYQKYQAKLLGEYLGITENNIYNKNINYIPITYNLYILRNAKEHHITIILDVYWDTTNTYCTFKIGELHWADYSAHILPKGLVGF